MTTNTPAQLIANPTEIINFHGLILFTYKASHQVYIPIKPIVDLIGTDWRTARKSITSGDNVDLFGTTTLLVPKIDNSGGLMLTETDSSNSPKDEIKTEKTQNSGLYELLCIRFDRVHMYLARINTSRLRVNGNVKAADYLLKLQHEWADVLNDYETHGIAVNKSLFDNAKHLKTLADVYHKLDDKQQRYLVSKQIDAALNRQPQQPEGQADLF